MASSHVSKSSEDKDYLNLAAHFGLMWKNNIHPDLLLKASHKSIPVHKCVLSARSPVFKILLSSERESLDAEDCLDVETVNNMLMYIYSGFVGDLDSDLALKLYMAAAKYELVTLKDVCLSFLKNHLSQDNACEVFLLATQYGDEDLQATAQQFISKPTEGSVAKRLASPILKLISGSSASTSDEESSLTEEQSAGIKNTLIADYKALLDSSIHSDVKLRVGGVEYPAHRCVLSARSAEFKTLLSNPSIRRLDIKGLDAATTSLMLRYIYSGQVEGLVWDRAIRLNGAADKYKISYLKRKCSSYLQEHLCVHNLVEMAEHIALHPDPSLAHFLLEFISEREGDVLKTVDGERLHLAMVKLELLFTD